jgi:hypothetical protein
MISRTIFCSAQASVMAFGPDGPDARHFAKPVRLGFDDVENLVRKRLDHLLGVDRPNSPDHSRAQIFLNPFDRTRR